MRQNEEKNNIFRDLYHQYVFISLPEEQKAKLENYSGIKEADHILAFGYVDEEDIELSLLVLACVTKTAFGYEIFDTVFEEDAVSIKAESVKEETYCKAEGIDEEDFRELTREKAYYEDADFLDFFESEDIDALRDPYRPTIVYVECVKDGLKPETIQVDCYGTSFNDILTEGFMVTRPKQNFGIKSGSITFGLLEEADGETVKFVADLNKKTKLKEKKGQARLEEAMAALEEHMGRANFDQFLDVFLKTEVYVPCSKVTERYAYDDNDYIEEGIHYRMPCTEINGWWYVPVFTNEKDAKKARQPYVLTIKGMDMIPVIVVDKRSFFHGIVVNPDKETAIIKDHVLATVEHEAIMLRKEELNNMFHDDVEEAYQRCMNGDLDEDEWS